MTTKMFANKLSKLFQVVFYFFLFYIGSIFVCLIPTLLMILTRTILSAIFKLFYKDKYRLMDASDSVFALDAPANVFQITLFLFANGPCDLDEVRKRVANRILWINDQTGQRRRRPYGQLLKSAVKKFGFMCWKDCSDSIDFNRHIRLCPGASDPSKVYTEAEVHAAVAKLADNGWKEDEPRWQILVTPKTIKNDDIDDDGNGNQMVGSGIVVVMHHMYADGISVTQFLRNVVVDGPPPKLHFDPVNPPTLLPHVPIYKKIFAILQLLVLGPYTLLRQAGYGPMSQNNVYCEEGQLTGPKFIGRVKMDIRPEMLKRIRQAYNNNNSNCSTAVILHSAFCGALSAMTIKKGVPVPDKIVGMMPAAKFPYPDEYLHNRAGVGLELMELGTGVDPIARLASINKSIVSNFTENKAVALESSLLFLKWIGLFPPWVVILLFSNSLQCNYCISNVPGIAGTARILGNEVGLMYGTGPLNAASRYTLGVSCYNGSFRVCFFLEKSKIIGTVRELEEMMKEFENQLKNLYSRSSSIKK